MVEVPTQIQISYFDFHQSICIWVGNSTIAFRMEDGRGSHPNTRGPLSTPSIYLYLGGKLDQRIQDRVWSSFPPKYKLVILISINLFVFGWEARPSHSGWRMVEFPTQIQEDRFQLHRSICIWVGSSTSAFRRECGRASHPNTN